jgi:hypothetical protein
MLLLFLFLYCVVNGLGIVPVGSIPTNNYRKVPKSRPKENLNTLTFTSEVPIPIEKFKEKKMNVNKQSFTFKMTLSAYSVNP